MYIVRDIFQLEFGTFKAVLPAIQSARELNLFPKDKVRFLSDFTGESYRLILEMEFPSLKDYEEMMSEGMKNPVWQNWYKEFKIHVRKSYREILKSVD